MERFWAAFDTATRALERAAMGVGIISLLAIMIVSVLDVGMRYALHKPFVWSYAVIANYLLVALVFLAMADTQATRHHVGVDAVVERSPLRTKGLLQLLSSLGLMIFAMLIVVPGFEAAGEAYRSNDVVPGIISWPKWPMYFLLALGLSIFALRGLCDAFGGLVVALGGTDAPLRRGGLDRTK